MPRKAKTRASAAPSRPSDRVLRSGSHTPAVAAQRTAGDSSIVQGPHAQVSPEANFLQEPPRPSIEGDGHIKIDEDSKTLISIPEIPSPPRPGQKEQAARRSGRNRFKTPDTGRRIPHPSRSEPTPLRTIPEEATPDSPRPTKRLGLTRKLDDTPVPATKRRARGVSQIGRSGTNKPEGAKHNTGPQDSLPTSIDDNPRSPVTTDSINEGNSTWIVGAAVSAVLEVPDTTATSEALSKRRADWSTGERSQIIGTSTDAKGSTILSAFPGAPDPDRAGVAHAKLNLRTRESQMLTQATTLATTKINNAESSYNNGLPIPSPGAHIFPQAATASEVATAKTRDTQLSHVITIDASPDVPHLQETRSERHGTRPGKRSQSPTAVMLPPRKRVRKPATTAAARREKPAAVATSKSQRISNSAPRSQTRIPVTQPKQCTSAAATQEPYKQTEHPTLMRYELDRLTGQLKQRYYKPHKDIKLEPPRKVDLNEDYYPAPQRPSFTEMVARQDKMYSEVKWDTSEITHEHQRPKGIMDGLPGFETEEEVNEYFDRIEMDGPDLSYAPMRMPRKNVLQPNPHVCEWCVRGNPEVQLGEHWCECEEYCGDPVGEYEAAVTQPGKDKKEKGKARNRWW